MAETDCDYCGETYEKRKSLIERYDNNYCSMECRNEDYRSDRVKFECEECGKVSETKKSKFERHDHNYCSRECSAKAKSIDANTTCDFCGKAIYVKPYRFERSENIFCSNQCKGHFYEENDLLKGENHPNWQGGPDTIDELRESNYYKNWCKQILARDNFACQKCKKKGGKLQVHHIEPVSESPEKVMDEDNVMAICKPCHQEKHPDVPIIHQEFDSKQIKLNEVKT